VSRKNYLFTSESVSEGHPDKVCDQISDAILDAFLANDVKLGIEDYSQINTRLGCETLTTTNKIVIAGECRGQEPLMKKYNVDFYVAGHDHDLQHLEIDGWKTSFILAGGGGAHVRPMRNDKRGMFSRSAYGFADFQFTDEIARCRLVGSDAAVLHEFTRAKDGAVTLNFTTKSDPAVPRTPRSINRPDVPASGPATQPAGE